MFRNVALVILLASGALAQTTPAKAPAQKKASPQMTTARKITLAESGGPAEIAKNATIFDMTDVSGMKQLRAGASGWACYAIVDAPMCLDKEWQKWMQALMSKQPPQINSTGVAYMLRGDNGASNTDPSATGPTAKNQWVVSPPHIMLIYQDLKMLDVYPTDPMNGGPWVMWKGTPYAHVMVPVASVKTATMPSK